MPSLKVRCAALILLLAMAALAGCSAENKIEKGKTLRIISTAPSITEILFALGLDKEIIGVTTLCNYPPKAKNKAKIGSFSRPNIEKLISLKPDIVLITGLEQAPVKNKLKELGINTVTIYPKDIDELYGAIEKIGELSGNAERADELVRNMKVRVNSITKKVEKIPDGMRKRLLIEMMDDPLIVASASSFVGHLGAIAGGVNIAYDTDRGYSRFSPELVIKRDPDCIILGYMFNDHNARLKVSRRLGWSNISAIKSGAIYNDIVPDVLLRPGPRAVLAIEQIYERLYGDK